MASVVCTLGGSGGGTFGLMMVLDLLWNEKRGFETELHEEQTRLLFNHRTTVTAVEFVETPVRTQLDLSSQRCHERKLKKKKSELFFLL